MDTTPHYRYECSDCGVGLTEELAFEDAGDVLCPHCHAGRTTGSPTADRWRDPGLPGP